MRVTLLVCLTLTAGWASGWISQIRHGRSRTRLTRQMKRSDGFLETTTEEPTTSTALTTTEAPSTSGSPSTTGGTRGPTRTPAQQTYDLQGDIVTRFLRIVESQQQLGENCTAGTDLNLGEGVVDKYAQVIHLITPPHHSSSR
ncbi:hypothetical protein GE061_000932 [Apolygus lucorum]|uniref:Uncharacterized protein n=1 Tax=Apolygus lucorum TaxID=248454 RepID=A0A6A4JHW8_APOLU|nr:hypothetical protein GE061_000932 [Apolygus lucorum]